jgi:hypothetical protein
MHSGRPIPDSPGSFAELGLFSLSDDICPKLLIIFDSHYHGDNSYLQRGPKICAENRRAMIEYLDYTNIENVWSVVESHINVVKQNIVTNKMLAKE